MIKCTACGIDKPMVDEHIFDARQAGTGIDSGLEIDVTMSGYYGGFVDCVPLNLFDDDYSRENAKHLKWDLCHDCVVKMLETFPLLADTMFEGGHPYNYEDGPCCKWGWTIKPEEEQ